MRCTFEVIWLHTHGNLSGYPGSATMGCAQRTTADIVSFVGLLHFKVPQSDGLGRMVGEPYVPSTRTSTHKAFRIPDLVVQGEYNLLANLRKRTDDFDSDICFPSAISHLQERKRAELVRRSLATREDGP